MKNVLRTEPPQLHLQKNRAARTLNREPGREKLHLGTHLTPDRNELARMIKQIREEADSHQRNAAELRAKMEKLTNAAFAELIKVKELENIIDRLKQYDHGQRENVGPEKSRQVLGDYDVSDPSNQKEPRAFQPDRELERLLTIKKLLESSRPLKSRKTEVPLASPSPESRKKKILVVDDDSTTVRVISHFLERENFTVCASLAGAEGLKKAFQEKPDLILLDIMMPDLNGFQFLSILQKDPSSAHIPVIILSSLAEEADVLSGLETGAVDYITKPFSPQVLLAKINKNLNSLA